MEVLAEAEGQLRLLTLSDTGKVSKLIYTAANGLTVTYDNGKYTVGDVFLGVTLQAYSSLTGQANGNPGKHSTS